MGSSNDIKKFEILLYCFRIKNFLREILGDNCLPSTFFLWEILGLRKLFTYDAGQRKANKIVTASIIWNKNN